MAEKKNLRVLSGIQPSGVLHLGNYFGMMSRMIRYQDENELFCFIANYHALTTLPDPGTLSLNTFNAACDFLALGMDPEKSTFWVQSDVPQVTELTWILSSQAGVGLMDRATSYKDKIAQGFKPNMGLYSYPVLMAADIILYDADEVPVGEDQKQHVELARDIAARFNRIYGETFVIPEPVIPEVGGRVMGLNDPSAKMSKSHADIRGHAIRMLDDPKEIERSLMRAVTDSYNEIIFSEDPDRGGVNNLLGIYKSVTGRTEDEVMNDFESARGYGDLKKAVAEVVIDELAPIRNRYEELIADTLELDRLLAAGAERAMEVSEVKLNDMKEKMGLIIPQK